MGMLDYLKEKKGYEHIVKRHIHSQLNIDDILEMLAPGKDSFNRIFLLDIKGV